MAVQCTHEYQLLKSDTSLVQWYCALCNQGPAWMIMECKFCKLKVCRACMQSSQQTHG